MLKCKCFTRWRMVFLVFATILGAGPAAAFDTFFAGPRAMGMGGANVASVRDSTAQYYNPAAFGFFGGRKEDGGRIDCDNNDLGRKSWGADLNAAAGYRLHNDFGSYLEELETIDLADLSAGLETESNLADLIRLVRGLEGLDRPENAVTADATTGFAARAGHFAVGVRGFLQASGQVLDIDADNLGLAGVTDLNTEINAITPDGFDNQILLFTPEQQAMLGSAGLDTGAIRRLDYLARQQGVASADSTGIADLLAGIAQQTNGAGGDLADNTTTVLLQGFGLAEVPFSYGYAINEHLAIGANVKFMQGRVYGNRVLVFDTGADELLRETDENYRETSTVGVDVGVMARFPLVNIGIVGRNLNAPKFDGFTETIAGLPAPVVVEDVRLDPQATAGVAFIPHETLTVEVDCDLTKGETAFPGYETQNLSIGLEWDAWRVLALRAGAYRNLAEDDIGWVYTAGLGFNLWAVRLDAAGAFSDASAEYDGDDVPRETRLAAQFSVDF